MPFFVTVLGMTIQVLNTKWKKNQFGGRKVVGQATVVAHWAQKVGGRLSPLPNIGYVANDPLIPKRLLSYWNLPTF